MGFLSERTLYYLRRLEWRVILMILLLMSVSLLVIAATTMEQGEGKEAPLRLTMTIHQVQWFFLGWVVFFLCALFDYRKLRDWALILYVVMILSLLGLFFTSSVQGVHRWYRLPFLGLGVQPSEAAKLIMVIALSAFLEIKGRAMRTWKTTLQALLIFFLPFFLILKQPDLGTAFVFFPMALVMFYFGSLRKRVVLGLTLTGGVAIVFSSLIFLGILPHEEMRPLFTKVLKEYQYERLSPDTYHQKAAQTAIALGGLTGTGWRKSEFAGRHWLPAAHTDSVFPAFAEEFGLIGVLLLLLLFFGLIYFSFQVTLYAKDRFGRLLAAGFTAYLALHILINMGMMCGFLPITGVPLILISYGGSSILATMAALGILQSISMRRYMF